MPKITYKQMRLEDGTRGYVYAVDQEALAVLRHDVTCRLDHLEGVSQNTGVSTIHSRVLRQDAPFYPPPRDNPYFQPDADWNLPPKQFQTVVKAS